MDVARMLTWRKAERSLVRNFNFMGIRTFLRIKIVNWLGHSLLKSLNVDYSKAATKVR